MPSLLEVLKFLGAGVLGLTLGVEGLSWLYRRLKPAGSSRISEVLFFPCESHCMESLFSDGRVSGDQCVCGETHSTALQSSPVDPFYRMLSHLLSARVSLDICVFSFSNFELSRAVLQLHARGVRVRVITDRDYQTIQGSQIGVLRKAGICVRHELSRSVHMHHKFCIVDGRLLLSGSLNWTMTAVQSNQENVLVTDHADIVAPYLAQFRRLWEANDPARHTHSPGNADTYAPRHHGHVHKGHYADRVKGLVHRAEVEKHTASNGHVYQQ
ncbi:mitochondrial cardiolipin hydrolase [Engraulis encrasicolus]|uniref:mitochondrial cardiolipin hydrolase n=1 Tax=Engraulis encrasicolus TaxID=184585 RepID=UPI002FD061C9